MRNFFGPRALLHVSPSDRRILSHRRVSVSGFFGVVVVRNEDNRRRAQCRDDMRCLVGQRATIPAGHDDKVKVVFFSSIIFVCSRFTSDTTTISVCIVCVCTAHAYKYTHENNIMIYILTLKVDILPECESSAKPYPYNRRPRSTEKPVQIRAVEVGPSDRPWTHGTV